MNNGMRTLQFQSLSVSPHNIDMLQGGTQDNGTWENRGPVEWHNTMIGDGGQSGFDVAIPEFRMHNFTGASPDVNFANGELEWIWTGDPLAHGGEFYSPVIRDPGVEDDVRRHRPDGLPDEDRGPGQRTLAQAHANCNEWTGTFKPGPAATGPSWARRG